MFPLLLFALELINARWPSLSQESFLPAIWEDVRWNRGGGVGTETSQGSDTSSAHTPNSAHTCFFPKQAGVRKRRGATSKHCCCCRDRGTLEVGSSAPSLPTSSPPFPAPGRGAPHSPQCAKPARARTAARRPPLL